MSVLPFGLTQERASRLLAYIQTHRRQALTRSAPSTERNATQRLLQALQGKLIHELDASRHQHASALVSLPLSNEEVKALKTMVTDLLLFTAREPATEQRAATLVDLSGLKGMVEKLPVYG